MILVNIPLDCIQYTGLLLALVTLPNPLFTLSDTDSDSRGGEGSPLESELFRQSETHFFKSSTGPGPLGMFQGAT